MECACCPRVEPQLVIPVGRLGGHSGMYLLSQVVSEWDILVGRLGGHSGMYLLSQSGIPVGYPSWKAGWSQWNVLVVPEWYPSWVS